MHPSLFICIYMDAYPYTYKFTFNAYSMLSITHCICICVQIYIYIYIYISRSRDPAVLRHGLAAVPALQGRYSRAAARLAHSNDDSLLSQSCRVFLF